jgi:hypothetical protein
MKEFTEQLNDLIASVTRAWTAPEIQRVVVEPGAIKEDEITVTATIKLKKRFGAVDTAVHLMRSGVTNIEPR